MPYDEPEIDPLIVSAVRTPSQSSVSSPDAEFRVYTRRWFILAVLCSLNFSNAIIWISFAPVADYSAHYYNRTLNDINLLSLVFLIVCFAFGLCASWVLDTLGLRAGVVIGAWLNAIGAGVRVLSGLSFISSPYKFTVVMAGQTIASLAQPFFLNSPTKLAALWFGAKERTTANMLASLSNPLGVLVASAVAPVLVGTDENQIPLMVGVFAIPAFLGVIMATFGICSSTPPSPPTASAALISQPFFPGLKAVLTNKTYLVLMVAFGCGIGLFSALTTLLQQIICPYGYNDTMAGTAGAVLIGGGLFGGGIAGWYVDKTKEFELTAKVSYGMAAIACCFFALISKVPNQQVAVLTASGLFGFFAFALMPVCLELGVECTYPVAEATSAGLQWIFGQLSGIIFIVVCQALAQSKSKIDLPHAKCHRSSDQSSDIPDLTWSMYFLAIVAVTVAIMFIILFKPRYHRLYAEQQHVSQEGIATLP